MWKPLVRLPARLALTLVMGLFLAALFVLGWISWRNLDRAQKVHDQVEYTGRLMALTLRLQESALGYLAGGSPPDSKGLEALRHDLDQFRQLAQHLDQRTARRLQEVGSGLLGPDPQTPGALLASFRLAREMMLAEKQAQGSLLEGIRQDTQRQLEVATGIAVGLAVLALVGTAILFSSMPGRK